MAAHRRQHRGNWNLPGGATPFDFGLTLSQHLLPELSEPICRHESGLPTAGANEDVFLQKILAHTSEVGSMQPELRLELTLGIDFAVEVDIRGQTNFGVPAGESFCRPQAAVQTF
jgi:hypothetical protein